MSWLQMSPLEIVSALLSIGSVWLSMRRSLLIHRELQVEWAGNHEKFEEHR